MSKKSIAVSILLTIVTCGIYGIYWYYTIADSFHRSNAQNRVATEPGITTLLYVVTCGIYGIYTAYVWGKATQEIAPQYGYPPEDKSILYLLLTIFGLSIVAFALVQSDINNWSDRIAPPPQGQGSQQYQPYYQAPASPYEAPQQPVPAPEQPQQPLQ